MNKKNPENLEFNDGLGDLLREKESRQFSLKRTLIVLVVFVAVVFVVLLLTVKVGTKFLFSPTDKINTVKTEDIDSDALVRELAEMERLMAEKKAQESPLEMAVTPSAQTPAKVEAEPSSREATRAPLQPPVPAKSKAPVPTKAKDAEVVPVTIPAKSKATVPAKAKDAEVAPVKKGAPVSEVPVKAVSPAAKPVPKPTVSVTIQKPSPAVKKSAPIFPYKVIVGTFSEVENARVLQTELKQQGIEAFLWDRDTDGKRWHAVQAAAFPDQASAQRFVATLRKKGYPAYVLRK
jgi:cell division septation protein DedD